MNPKIIFKFRLALIVLILSFFIYPKIEQYFRIDKCLDSGGKWNYKTKEFEFQNLINIDN